MILEANIGGKNDFGGQNWWKNRILEVTIVGSGLNFGTFRSRLVEKIIWRSKL